MAKNVCTIFTFIFFFGICAARAQNISLKFQDAPLQTVFKEIEKQTSFVFFSDKAKIDGVKVSIDIHDVPLEKALTLILANRGLEYNVFGKTIAIKKTPPPAERNERDKQKKTGNISNGNIRGQVLDENNLPLLDIYVECPVDDKAVYTDKNGEFELSGISPAGVLTLSAEGFLEQYVNYTDSAVLRVTMKKDKAAVNYLTEVSIQSANNAKTNPNKFVDLTNRSYMNLAQVLQGTIPGLTLQTTTATVKVPTSVDVFVNRLNGQVYLRTMRMSIDEFLNYKGKVEGQRIIDQLLNGKKITGISVNTTSRTSTTLVPQVRGANGFSGSTEGMLVVIDGFPQSGFPANYPMTNVESIEVIKDPRELIKWGTRANNGLILIKTKVAKKGSVTVNYSANFYFEPIQKYNREKLRLASTSDYLDYVKDVDAVFEPVYTETAFNFTPAQRLFARNRNGLISAGDYNRSLDSLKRLDNEAQLRTLQQESFSQNHTLNLNGGGEIYRFNLLGNYLLDQSHDIGAYNKTVGLNLNNEFSLLKKKLHITWLINYSSGTTRTGANFSPSVQIEPYQMLLDNQGNYVYDYSNNFAPYANDIIQRNGYFNNGVNILQDARLNKNLTRITQKRTNLNFRYDPIPGLNLSGSVYYDGSSNTSNQVYGAESSYARQLVNSYGQYSPTGVNFYVPYGDILQMNERNGEQWNLRSGLSYDKTFGRHSISMSLGGGGSSTDNTRPNNGTIFGYNAQTGTGSPIFLPTPNATGAISNYYSLLNFAAMPSVYPYNLTLPLNGDTTRTRNLNWNASFAYQFAGRLTLSGRHNTVLSPLVGGTEAYSQLTNQNADITGVVIKRPGKVVQDVALSMGVDRIKMPDLPAVYSNTRGQQITWGNYAIWVNGLLPTQQQGQSSTNIYQKLTINFLDSVLTTNVAYNTQRRTGNLQSLSTDPAALSATAAQQTTIRYLSAGLNAVLRKSLLRLQLNYSKSPEGQSMVNGAVNYDLAHEKFFHSKTINVFNIGYKMENISPFQGIGLVMGTNVASNGSFSQAVNSNYSLLPPNNKNYELYTTMAMDNDTYTIDLRYYKRITSGLNNNTPSLTDPSTGLSSRVTYSTIANKGVEAYFKVRVVNTRDFSYQATLNGAYNVNIATDVPDPVFYGSSDYATMYRSGYDISNIWSVKSAGLNNQGNPQVYDANGQPTALLDSATITAGMVYSGKTRAPWTGGFIHDVRYKAFFMRASITFNLGHVFRTYIPYPSNNYNENSILIKDRWRKPGDENFTDVPVMDNQNPSALGFRSFTVQNGTNSILSADNIRLQELMVGCSLPAAISKRLGIEGCTIALTAQNLGAWTRNKYHIDPVVVDGVGRLGLPQARQYSLNINVSF